MRSRSVAALGLLLALTFAGSASPHGAEDEVGQPAKALAIQALAILEQGGSHEEAIEKLELAGQAEDKEGVKPQVLEAAMAALESEDSVRGEQLLEGAFTEENVHVVGVTVRPGSWTARVAAGVAGGLILLFAVFGLARRARLERRPGAL